MLTDVLLKTEILDNCKVRELNNSNNNILDKEFAFNNKEDQGILDGNIGNLLDDVKYTRETLRLISRNIDRLQEKITFY